MSQGPSLASVLEWQADTCIPCGVVLETLAQDYWAVFLQNVAK